MVTPDGYAASEVLQALILALNSRLASGTAPESLRVVGVSRGNTQWPISVEVAVTKSGWHVPRMFEVHFTAEDAHGTALSELGAVLATNVLTVIEEWLAIGPVPGVNELEA